MIEPRDRPYLMEILGLAESKSRKIRRYAKFSAWLFKLSNHYKHKAKMLAISGGNPEKFQNKIKDRMGKINASASKNKYVANYIPQREKVQLQEPTSKTYQDAKKNKEPMNVVPAKPGFFKMTDDVPTEKKAELEKVSSMPVKDALFTGNEINKATEKKAQARKFYYKRKKKKFNPQKFNNDRKDN